MKAGKGVGGRAEEFTERYNKGVKAGAVMDEAGPRISESSRSRSRKYWSSSACSACDILYH